MTSLIDTMIIDLPKVMTYSVCLSFLLILIVINTNTNNTNTKLSEGRVYLVHYLLTISNTAVTEEVTN